MKDSSAGGTTRFLENDFLDLPLKARQPPRQFGHWQWEAHYDHCDIITILSVFLLMPSVARLPHTKGETCDHCVALPAF